MNDGIVLKKLWSMFETGQIMTGLDYMKNYKGAAKSYDGIVGQVRRGEINSFTVNSGEANIIWVVPQITAPIATVVSEFQRLRVLPTENSMGILDTRQAVFYMFGKTKVAQFYYWRKKLCAMDCGAQLGSNARTAIWFFAKSRLDVVRSVGNVKAQYRSAAKPRF